MRGRESVWPIPGRVLRYGTRCSVRMATERVNRIAKKCLLDIQSLLDAQLENNVAIYFSAVEAVAAQRSMVIKMRCWQVFLYT